MERGVPIQRSNLASVEYPVGLGDRKAELISALFNYFEVGLHRKISHHVVSQISATQYHRAIRGRSCRLNITRTHNCSLVGKSRRIEPFVLRGQSTGFDPDGIAAQVALGLIGVKMDPAQNQPSTAV